MILTILIAVLAAWALLEGCTVSIYCANGFIWKQDTISIAWELATAERISPTFLSTKGESDIKCWYIARTTMSLLYPYYICDEDKRKYGVLRWTTSYYLIKNKFKET